MKKRKLGMTDLEVSEICLGTMTWGQQNTESEGHQQMDYALDKGINFFDTAEMYAVPPKKETQGSTERIIGSWFKERKSRDKVILATKVSGRSPLNWLRDGDKATEQSKEQIFEAVDKSLIRLGVDYIDLYQLHWPDRPMNLFGGSINYEHMDEPSIDISIILDSLNELVKSGKIRYIGLSNETPWGTMKYLQAANAHNLVRPVTIQNSYSMIHRGYEVGMSEVSMREDIGLLAYSPLAQGVLSGKYLDGKSPEGSRGNLFPRFIARYMGDGSSEAVKRYQSIAEKNGITLTELSLAFVNQLPFVTSNIIGATKMSQLKENIGSIHIELSEETLQEIQEVHAMIPNPAP